MKRIRFNHNNNDHVICVSVKGKHRFYYQPVRTQEKIWLFDTKGFSGSVYGFFRKNGRMTGDREYTMTIREIYQIGKSRNSKINKIFDHIPAQIEYILRENTQTDKVAYMKTGWKQEYDRVA